MRLRNTSGSAIALNGKSIVTNLPAPVSPLTQGSGIGMAYSNKAELSGGSILVTYTDFAGIYVGGTYSLADNEMLIVSAYYIAK